MKDIHNRQGDVFVNTFDTTGAAAAKSAPAIGGTVYSLAELPAAEVAAWATVLYTSLLITDWCWKKVKAYKAWRAGR